MSSSKGLGGRNVRGVCVECTEGKAFDLLGVDDRADSGL